MYYGRACIKSDLERGHCPPNHAIKTTVIWDPENHCRIFDVGRSYARMTKFQKRYFIETLENNEANLGHKHNAHMYSSGFQKHLYDESAPSRFEVLTKSSTNVMKTAYIMPLNIKAFSYNTKKALTLSRENGHPTLITHTSQSLTDHPL